MPDDYVEHFSRFLRANKDLNSLLMKIDERKIAGNYFISKAIKEGIPGYVLRIKLFVPESPKGAKKRKVTARLEEVWIVNDQARLLITTPPGLIQLSSLGYDGNWLRAKTVRGKDLSFFLGIPLLWGRKRTTYSNGVLQVIAPLRPLLHSRMKLSKAATKASKV